MTDREDFIKSLDRASEIVSEWPEWKQNALGRIDRRNKIHIGCGKRNFGKDWYHIDGNREYTHLDSFDITSLRQFNDNSIKLIYASHVIEYFDREEIIPILKEWQRTLKPNGILRLAVPSFSAMCMLYQEYGYDLSSFLGPLYGRMKMGDNYIYHKTCYDFKSLYELLKSIGFHSIKKYDWITTEHAQFDDHSQCYLPHMDKDKGILISLNVECNK